MQYRIQSTMQINNEISPAKSDATRKERTGIYCTPVDNSKVGNFVMEEVWKNIDGYNGEYQVSNMGRVYSVKNRMLLKESFNKDGYVLIALYNNGNRRGCSLHRLVAKEFILNTENKPEVNHKDLNKTNNRADNLEWVTKVENMRHAVENGKFQMSDERKSELSKRFSGENSYLSKLTEDQVKEIRKLREVGVKRVAVAEMFNVDKRTITDITNFRTWKHIK